MNNSYSNSTYTEDHYVHLREKQVSRAVAASALGLCARKGEEMEDGAGLKGSHHHLMMTDAYVIICAIDCDILCWRDKVGDRSSRVHC